MSCNTKKYEAYLFVHFVGESEIGEQIYFSISNDGLHWNDLNHGQPVLTSTIGELGVRDPFIIRSQDDDTYYIIGTDLRIANNKGWNAAQYAGSRDLLIWQSSDLIHWSKVRAVTVGVEGAGCVWAPEAVYDEERKEFFVFFASMVQNENDSEPIQKIFYTTTKDFVTFTSTKPYIVRENHVIDTTILYEEGIYYRYSKDESTKNIRIDYSDNLYSNNFVEVHHPVIDNLYGVEGPIIYKFNDREEWCLLVDQYATMKGYLPLVTNDLKSGQFRILDSNEYDMGMTKKRHGSVLKITKEEYDRLLCKYIV